MGAAHACSQSTAEACQGMEQAWVCQDNPLCPAGLRTSVFVKQEPVLEANEEDTKKIVGEPSLSKSDAPADADAAPGETPNNDEISKNESDANLLKDMELDVPVKAASVASIASISDAASPDSSWATGSITSRSSVGEKKVTKKKKKPSKEAPSGPSGPSTPKMKAILIFETGSGEQTCTFFKKPPGFAIRFPVMTVSRVTGEEAIEMGMQEGWKLLKWGSTETEMHSLDNGEEKSALRQSYVSMIQQLPRDPGGSRAGSKSSSAAGSGAGSKSSSAAGSGSAPKKDEAEEIKGPHPASMPGKWAYELDVTVVSAKGLRDADWGGSSDPYCVVTVQGRGKSTFKTPVVKNNKNPSWNHSSRVTDMHDGDQLHFEIFDHDQVGKHEKLGYAAIGWEELQDESKVVETLVLEESGRKKGSDQATVDVKLNVLKRKLEITQIGAPQNLYRLYVNIKSARGLRDADTFFGGGGSDPYCVCSVVGTGTSKYKTKCINNATDPAWEETCVLPDFHKGDKLLFEIYDKDIGKKDDFLGKCEVSGQKALSGFKETEVQLKETGMINKKPVEAFLTLACDCHKRNAQGLAPFHNTAKLKSGSVKYELEVRILSADGLRNADWLSSGSDPYCACTVKGKGKTTIKTKTMKNEHSPLWKHVSKIEDFYHGDALYFTVKDADPLKYDDLLGQVQLQTGQIVPDGFDGDLKLRNTGWKDPENHPVYVTVVIKVLSRQKVTTD